MLNYKKTNKSSSKRSAFTLIELSIVLIIIGLLVAGITGGASLIKSAELRAVMAEARDYKTAANAFLVKYDALPGDYGTALTTAVAGNGDGTIAHYGNGTTLNEGQNALAALFDADMGGKSGLTPTAPAAIAITTDFPASRIKTAGWTFGNRAVAKNVVVLTDSFTPATVNAIGTDLIAGISGNQASSIDRKMDDGTSTTGTIRNSGTCAATDVIDCALTFDL